MNIELDIASKAAFVQVMTAMHEWEIKNIEMLRCMTGRQLYFPMASKTVQSTPYCQIKEILVSDHLSEKAMRNRLAQLVESGYIDVKPGYRDKRTKQLYISQNFDDLVNIHINQFYKLLSERFFIIDKEAMNSPDGPNPSQ